MNLSMSDAKVTHTQVYLFLVRGTPIQQSREVDVAKLNYSSRQGMNEEVDAGVS